MKKSIINAINSISDNVELNEAIDLLKKKQKQLRAQVEREMKSKLSVGDKVYVNSQSLAANTVAEIISIARTKATISINGGRYKASLSMLKLVK